MEQVKRRRRLVWPSGGLWREADFLKLWSAQAISAVGSRIARTALPILAVMTIGASVEEVAVLSALALAPGVIVGLAMGGRVDRRAKRPLLIGADLVRAALLLTVPLAAWLGRLSMGQLYTVAALTGAATTLFQIADRAFLPALIGRERLVEGNAKLEATEAVAEISGPGLGGLLVQAITAPLAIAFDAISFLASAVLLGAIRRPEAPAVAETDGDRPTLIKDLRVGLRACMLDPLVRPGFLVDAVSAFVNGIFAALYTVFALKTLGLSPATLGLIISVGGIGALFGALLAGRLSKRLGLGSAMIVCMTGCRLAAPLDPDGPWPAMARRVVSGRPSARGRRLVRELLRAGGQLASDRLTPRYLGQGQCDFSRRHRRSSSPGSLVCRLDCRDHRRPDSALDQCPRRACQSADPPALRITPAQGHAGAEKGSGANYVTDFITRMPSRAASLAPP